MYFEIYNFLFALSVTFLLWTRTSVFTNRYSSLECKENTHYAPLTKTYMITASSCTPKPFVKQTSSQQPGTSSKPIDTTVCGEDALLIKEGISDNRQLFYLGVADGVGGWQFDTSLVSSSLLSLIAKSIGSVGYDAAERSMEEFLRWSVAEAHDHLAKENISGTCTCCFVVFDSGPATLFSFNYGDSGYFVIRPLQQQNQVQQQIKDNAALKYPMHSELMGNNSKNNKTQFAMLLHQSIHQYHSFNMPFQLGYFDGVKYGSPERAASIETLHLEVGDLVVVASDGVFDNLFMDEMMQVLDPLMHAVVIAKGGGSPLRERKEFFQIELKRVADHIIELVKTRSHYGFELVQTPFSVSAVNVGRMEYANGGGKPDDTSVALGLVI